MSSPSEPEPDGHSTPLPMSSPSEPDPDGNSTPLPISPPQEPPLSAGLQQVDRAYALPSSGYSRNCAYCAQVRAGMSPSAAHTTTSGVSAHTICEAAPSQSSCISSCGDPLCLQQVDRAY